MLKINRKKIVANPTTPSHVTHAGGMQQAVTVLYCESETECSVDVEARSSSNVRRMSLSSEITDSALQVGEVTSEFRDNLLAERGGSVSPGSSVVKEGCA